MASVADRPHGNTGKEPWNKALENSDPRIALWHAASGRARRGKHMPWLEEHYRSMNLIKSPTGIELMLARSLQSRELHYTKESVEGIVIPDAVIKELKVAFFVDGCYWHSCPEHFPNSLPNRKMRMKDSQITAVLQSIGWTVLRAWEHELKVNPDILGERFDAEKRGREELSGPLRAT